MINIVLDKIRNLSGKFDIDSEGLKIATELKLFMDKEFGSFWHVVCGRHFGCYSIHEKNNFIYLYHENVAYMLYKSG